MVKEDKLKALDAALGQIEKQFGKGSVMKLGDSSVHMNVETVLQVLSALTLHWVWEASRKEDRRGLRSGIQR